MTYSVIVPGSIRAKRAQTQRTCRDRQRLGKHGSFDNGAGACLGPLIVHRHRGPWLTSGGLGNRANPRARRPYREPVAAAVQAISRRWTGGIDGPLRRPAPISLFQELSQATLCATWNKKGRG